MTKGKMKISKDWTDKEREALADLIFDALVETQSALEWADRHRRKQPDRPRQIRGRIGELTALIAALEGSTITSVFLEVNRECFKEFVE